MIKHVKGVHKGLTDNTYDFEVANFAPGRAPDTVWMALDDHPELGESLVTLVGFVDQVFKFARRAARLSRETIPFIKLGAPPGFPDEFSIAIAVAGVWPAAISNDIVRQISNDGVTGYGAWSRAFVKLAKHPQRAKPPIPSEEFARELGHLFLQQCELATKAGGA